MTKLQPVWYQPGLLGHPETDGSSFCSFIMFVCNLGPAKPLIFSASNLSTCKWAKCVEWDRVLHRWDTWIVWQPCRTIIYYPSAELQHWWDPSPMLS